MASHEGRFEVHGIKAWIPDESEVCCSAHLLSAGNLVLVVCVCAERAAKDHNSFAVGQDSAASEAS